MSTRLALKWKLLAVTPGLVLVTILSLLLIFVLPLAPCPNCTTPGIALNDGTHGTYDDGKKVVEGCWDCSDKKVTYFRRWTWDYSQQGK